MVYVILILYFYNYKQVKKYSIDRISIQKRVKSSVVMNFPSRIKLQEYTLPLVQITYFWLVREKTLTPKYLD